MQSKVRSRLALSAIFLIASSVFAGTSSVKLETPIRPRLPLRGNERIALAPFIIASDTDRKRDRRVDKIDLQAEFRKFIAKQLRKTKLEVVATPAQLTLPTQNLAELGRAKDFWRAIGTESGAELIISGSIEFRIEDRTGYRTEEYTSPISGQNLYRQIYVENTGYTFDILILVFDARTGEKIFQDEFRDTRQTSSGRMDELKGLFENLFSLETQIMNLFVVRSRTAARFLLD
jgi:hypothetical protein